MGSGTVAVWLQVDQRVRVVQSQRSCVGCGGYGQVLRRRAAQEQGGREERNQGATRDREVGLSGVHRGEQKEDHEAGETIRGADRKREVRHSDEARQGRVS